MKKSVIITFIAVSLSLLCASCLDFIGKETIKGNGELTTKSIVISDFCRIEIETYVEVNYSQAQNSGTLEFTIDENLWEYYHIFTKDDVLYIKLKEEYKRQINPKATKSLITVSSELLENIDIAGCSDFNFCTAFTSENLNIDLAGSSNIIANKHPLQIKNLDIDIAGSANVFLTGTIQKAKIEIAGSGDVKALECEIAHLSIAIAGSGDVEAHVTEKLTVEIAGSGDVRYIGDPVVTSSIAGSGKIKKI
jgi:hypothetical protein